MRVVDLARLFPSTPPPGPFRRSAWRSPLRGRWLTSVLGAVLLAGMPLVIVTGLLSYAAYNPELGGNDLHPTKGLFGFYLFDWPTRPVWLYAANQGVHVIGGLALLPVVLAKLWSVLPKLFTWPPIGTPAQALERLSLALLVGGVLFQFATGIMNIQYWYDFPFSFYTAHFYGAWVFIGAFLAHVVIKVPQMRRSLRERGVLSELRRGLEDTRAEGDPEDDELVATDPAAATISRRGALALAGGTSAAVLVMTAGQTIGGPMRRVALLAPRGRALGDGPNDFQVNMTAAAAGVTPGQTGQAWRLVLRSGDEERSLSRAELLGLEQHTYDLPIACVEGWSTTQTWTGVRLRDLAALAGAPGARELTVESIQTGGAFRETTFSARQVGDEMSLLALRVNGADLSLDHGFPARIIIPANPGVHNTKWVQRMTFVAA
jgi:DMSO/TMAO reductase YedYZ molybdopterin-dependent catalytic subunit